MVRPERGKDSDVSEIRVQFPYSHLKAYLRDRGFDRLANSVRWDPDDSKLSPRLRTKNFINEMKVELDYYTPQQTRELSRVEGHIRLHGSLWYACFYLEYIAIVGLIVGLISNCGLYIKGHFYRIEIIIRPVCVYIISFFFQHLTEKAFHYQRSREVFFVLQNYELFQAARAKLPPPSP